MKNKTIWIVCLLLIALPLRAQVPAVPPAQELNRPFGEADKVAFQSPPLVYHPETWFHFIGGNVSKKGITADLEAIAKAGLSGIQFFHGQFGGAWPGVDPQISCLSESWDEHVRYLAEECRRLGLRFTMQNCPGWAMSGGPWIKPENTMRNLIYSRTDLTGDQADKTLPRPQPSDEDWRDYKDLFVLAFPTPEGDTDKAFKPVSAKGSDVDWDAIVKGTAKDWIKFSPASEDNPHWFEVTFPETVIVRTLLFPSYQGMNYYWCYEPNLSITAQALMPDGQWREILHTPLPQSSWQDYVGITLACDETPGAKTYRVTIANKHEIEIPFPKFYSASRKNNWEAEAGWCLRSIMRVNENPKQSPETFVKSEQIIDITSFMNSEGKLTWKAPSGKWTVLRIGHVNTGRKNGPAPEEATGWECNKLSKTGPQAHFDGYIGRLSNGPLAGGLLNGMLMDSWECSNQTWTDKLEWEFEQQTAYPLRRWLPAVFGYVLDDHETSFRFLRDWRGVIGDLFANRFFGGMAELAKANGLNLQFETAAGDVFTADLLEYYKHADVPMCEFWQPITESWVGAINFKPIKPTVSAARLYGKPRVAAEAFTSFHLTWDEHLSMLKEVANINCIEGVTHLVFHTYTHNPRTDWLPPGTSFGSNIGTPFLRNQTWWKHMPEFTAYLSRLNYLFERGKPVSDVLWYLGDEINHKPDEQYAPFPEGFKYDYCNPDVLLNRLSVRDGKIVTPEGLAYSVLWLPENKRMLPETVEKLLSLVNEGAVIVGNAPEKIATLKGGKEAQQRFDAAVKKLWGNNASLHSVGKGKVLSGKSIFEAVKQLNLQPDVTGNDALWLHRRAEGADWYYVCAPLGRGFQGNLSFNNSGSVEIWDPISGEISTPDIVERKNGRTSIRFDLPQAGSCFVVFGKKKGTISQARNKKTAKILTLSNPWTLEFPEGWGAPASIRTNELKAWKDLAVSPEANAFSGTVTYTTTFDVEQPEKGNTYTLDLGRVEMIASVKLNGKELRTLWTPPYRTDITNVLKPGSNRLQIEVTSTWFNRLVYDANLPDNERKTWTINAPAKESPLRESGLLGPVTIFIE